MKENVKPHAAVFELDLQIHNKLLNDRAEM